MPSTYSTLDQSDAGRMIAAAELAAERTGVPYCIAVVDAGGHLLAFTRQDGALIGCIELAIGKARTARLFVNTTAELGKLAQPGAELYGIEHSNAGTVLIGGGVPIVSGGKVLGAIGASAGTVAQDIAVATAAIEVLDLDRDHSEAPEPHSGSSQTRD